jgi:23S rRNA maturation mini-RNase III
MSQDEPPGWRTLQEKAQRERDPKKLAALIDEMNRLLTEHEKAAQGRRKNRASKTRPRSAGK